LTRRGDYPANSLRKWPYSGIIQLECCLIYGGLSTARHSDQETRNGSGMTENRKIAKKHLPVRMKPFFWDYPFHLLRMDKDLDLIISRLLSRGDWEAVKWLRARLPEDELKSWLTCRRGAGLSPQKLRFWELVLELPERDVNDWLQDENRRIWDQRFVR